MESLTQAQMRDACGVFLTSAFSDLNDTDHRVVFMSPGMFLRLAAPIAARIPSQTRRAEIASTLDAGRRLSDLPYLELEFDGEEAFVMTHDGRHRGDCQEFRVWAGG